MALTISVITICYNNLEELQKTCRSVDEQTKSPTEHLIIDGSKNDQILKWITGKDQPSYRRLIHERDQGISDAFNKGVRNARGELTHLLNSGDYYATRNVMETVLKHFEDDPQLMWLHGRYIQHRGGIDVISGVPFEKEKLWKGMRTVAHPTMFIKKEVYDRHGLYNLDYKIAMDYDMLVRIREEKNVFVPTSITYFAPGGASNIHFHKGLKEVKRIHESHLGKSTKLEFWQLRQRALHSAMNTPVGRKLFQLKNKNKQGDQ